MRDFFVRLPRLVAGGGDFVNGGRLRAVKLNPATFQKLARTSNCSRLHSRATTGSARQSRGTAATMQTSRGVIGIGESRAMTGGELGL